MGTDYFRERNVHFLTLQDTLEGEHVHQDPAKSCLVPVQFYARTLKEFASDFLKLVDSQAVPSKTVLCFVDGVHKVIAGNPRSADDTISDILASVGFHVDLINVSRLAGFEPQDLHASLDLVPLLQEVLAKSPQSPVIVLGSGSITDVVKHAIFLSEPKAPFLVVPTALTVTAFTSTFAVLEKAGAKKTHMSQPPTATFWIEPLIANAPGPLSRAGYGDLLARFVAYADWYLGFKLGICDKYDELAYRLMEPFASHLRTVAKGFAGDVLPADVTASTAAALAMAGIAMSVSGETTPLSGFEHVISHALDFLRMTAHRPLVLHGEQVALATLTSARCYDWLLSIDKIETMPIVVPDNAEARANIESLVKTAPFELPEDVAPPASLNQAALLFADEFVKKNTRWAKTSIVFAGIAREWPAIRHHVAEVTARAPEIEHLLREAGLPVEPEQTDPTTSSTMYKWAVRFSPFIRARFSLSDLIAWFGRDPVEIGYKA